LDFEDLDAKAMLEDGTGVYVPDIFGFVLDMDREGKIIRTDNATNDTLVVEIRAVRV